MLWCDAKEGVLLGRLHAGPQAARRHAGMAGMAGQPLLLVSPCCRHAVMQCQGRGVHAGHATLGVCGVGNSGS